VSGEGQEQAALGPGETSTFGGFQNLGGKDQEQPDLILKTLNLGV